MMHKTLHMLLASLFWAGTGCQTAGVPPSQVSSARNQSNSPAAAGTRENAASQDTAVKNGAESGYKSYRGRYSNNEYGFAVLIPESLVGLGDRSPRPQHGVRIILSEQPQSVIHISASYNSLLYASLDEFVDADLRYLAEEGGQVEPLLREPARLQNLKAMRVVSRYSVAPANERLIQDLLVALRRAEDEGPEILYTIRLRTIESRYEADKKVLSQIINGWELKPPGQ